MDILDKIEKDNYNSWKRKPELIQELGDWLNANTNIDVDGLSQPEMVFLIRNGYVENPRCYCGNFIEYKYNKYRQYCSSKCSANNKTTLSKRKVTVNTKYGCDNVFQFEGVKAKSKLTNLKNYGVENPFKIGSKLFNECMLDIHGVENASQLEFVKDKVRKVEWSKTYNGLSRFANTVTPLFSEIEYIGCGYDKEYDWHCSICGEDFVSWYHNGWVPKCTHCIKNSKFQDEVEAYLQDIGFKYSTNNRTVLSGLELDIYSATSNIAVECDGNYWHTDTNGKDKKYHVGKTNECENKGIQLIHIFEDEWVFNTRIVKSRLRHISNNSKYKLYGRKCEIREITTKCKNSFLNKYHIQGTDKSSVKLGGFYNGRLVAVMTFGKRRFDNKDGYELIRYATIRSFTCVGVAGKLLKYFERNWNPKAIISYADRRWSTGGLYNSIGFKFKHNSNPSYYYVKSNYLMRINRINFQKHKLKDKLEIFDPNITEWENMKVNGYDRIWDCGNMVFEKTY